MRVEILEKVGCALFTPKRWKILYSGRGAGKSQNIARALLVKGRARRHKIICTREIQKSIDDSVHALLKQEIESLGMGKFYEVTRDSIIGRNGTEFLFAGLRSNISSIKSIPGLTIAWVEEAITASAENIKTLGRTVRAPNSEIWLSFNPDLEDDLVYQQFVVDPPSDSIVVKLNWQDNPFFPESLRKDMEDDKRRSEAVYLHEWEGHCKVAVEGAIFSEELRKASEEHRITKVPIQPGVPVQTFWDLGQSDNTAIWFVQIVGMEFRFIDYYQNNGHKIAHYLEELINRGYNYEEHCLPHDAEHDQIAAQATIKQQVQNALRDNPRLGKNVRVVPRIPKKALAIEAARSIFPQSVFDKEKCADGLQCLRHSSYAKDTDTGKVSKEPKHDMWSHGADAFMQCAQHYKRPQAMTMKSIMMG